MKYQTACPKCSHLFWISPGKSGTETNCPKCHHVFAIEGSPPGASYAECLLELAADPAMLRFGACHYGALAPRGITPESSFDEILKEFPEDPEEEPAYDALTRIPFRLEEDLLHYPLWRQNQ